MFVTLYMGNVSPEWVLLFITVKIFCDEMENSLRVMENSQICLKA